MSACKRILIFGATGLIGRHIVQQILIRKGDFDRIAIFTSPDTVESKVKEIKQLEAEGAEILVGSLMNEADVRKAYQGELVKSLLALEESSCFFGEGLRIMTDDEK